MNDREKRVLRACVELLGQSRPGVYPTVNDVAAKCGLTEQDAGASLQRLAGLNLIGVINAAAEYDYPTHVHEITAAGRRFAAS